MSPWGEKCVHFLQLCSPASEAGLALSWGSANVHETVWAEKHCASWMDSKRHGECWSWRNMTRDSDPSLSFSTWPFLLSFYPLFSSPLLGA